MVPEGEASMNSVTPRLLAVVMLAVGAARGAAAQYVPIDDGTLGGTISVAMAVNDSGQVVGDSFIAGNAEFHAFSWTAAGGIVDLGTVRGTDSEAVAVNSSGQVVGNSNTANNSPTCAFLWTATGGMIDLGTLGGPRQHSSSRKRERSSGWLQHARPERS